MSFLAVLFTLLFLGLLVYNVYKLVVLLKLRAKNKKEKQSQVSDNSHDESQKN